MKSLNHHFLPQSVGVSGWFPRGLLSHIGRLYGWTDSPISLGGGPQSWLCSLISLALESIEIARCVSRLSTGPHHLVPDPQREFWCSTALEIIQMFCVHMQSLTHDSEVAQGLQDNCDGWPVPSDQNRKTSLFSVVAPTNHHVYREAIVASNPFVALHLGRSPAPPRCGCCGLFQKQDLHISQSSLGCFWEIIMPQSAK